MAKKRRAKKLTTARGAQAKARARTRRNSIEPKSNPGAGFMAELYELGDLVIPAFAGYAGGRMISRIAYVQAQKKWPKAAKHLAAGAGALTILAAYLALPRVKRFEKYQVPATLGAAIAALQSIVQTYLPKFGWMVSDYRAAIETSSPAATQVAMPTLSPEELELLEADAVELDNEGGMDIDPKGPSFDTSIGAMDDGDFDDLDMN